MPLLFLSYIQISPEVTSFKLKASWPILVTELGICKVLILSLSKALLPIVFRVFGNYTPVSPV